MKPAESQPALGWTALVAASAGLFLAALDITVNVALPEITDGFGTTVERVQWVIILYVGTATGLQLGFGSAADVYGLKRVYMLGLVVYTLAVLLIGVAPALPVVLAMRVLQAVGNALIAASVPALVTTMSRPEARGRALGTMTALGTLGLVAGALGGGVLVDALGWRAIFLGRVPLCLLALALARAALREYPPPADRVQRFDLRGAVVLFVSISFLVLFVRLGATTGWASPLTLSLAVLSGVGLAASALLEHGTSHPVLDVGIVRNTALVVALVSGFLISASTFVNWFILPYYVVEVLGGSAKALGLLLTLTSLASAAAAPAGGWLSDKLSPAPVATVALALSAGTVLWLSTLGIGSTIADVALRMAALGLGMGLFQAANASIVMGSVPMSRVGTGAGLMGLSRSLGAVSSVVVLGAVFSSSIEGPGAPQLSGEDLPREAFVEAFQKTYWLAAALAAFAALVSLAHWPRLRRWPGADRRP